MYNLFYLLHPGKPKGLLGRENNLFYFIDFKQKLKKSYFPNIKDPRIPYLNSRTNKYTYPGFLEIEKNDLVVDIGAYVGEFSIPASKIAGKVIAFEPSPDTFECLKKNTKDINNISVHQYLIGESNKKVNFNLSDDPSENSLINIDSGQSKGMVKIQSYRLPKIMHELGIENIDFLKVEAEGAEPEIIKNLGSLKINKIAVDCGLERYGKSPIKEITSLLIDQGFEVRKKGTSYILYAKK